MRIILFIASVPEVLCSIPGLNFACVYAKSLWDSKLLKKKNK